MGYNPFDFIGKDKRKRVGGQAMKVAQYVVTENKLREMVREELKNQGYSISGAKKLLMKSSLKLDGNLDSGIKNKNFRNSLKIRAEKIKVILKKIKDFSFGF